MRFLQTMSYGSFTLHSAGRGASLETVLQSSRVSASASPALSGVRAAVQDIQGARFHPLRSVDQRKLAGRVALGLPVDDRQV